LLVQGLSLDLGYNLFPATTLRAAVFRVFKRTLLTNQTVEPTQVAGFNQFFDDAEETESWRYGIALDQKFSRNIFGGIEYSQRDLKTPISVGTPEDPASLEIQKIDWEERLGRVYLFWTPHNWLSLSAEYQYERFDRKEYPIGFENLKTNRFPLGINFYHPSGFSAKLRATYFDQEGMILPQFLPPGSPSVPGNDQFWVVDGSISYRLPKRLGLLTFGVTNLFDEDFMYQDTDPARPQIQPKRLIFARLTLAI